MPDPHLEIAGVPGLPEVRPGDDLAAAILTALDAVGRPLRDGDVLVISSKVVSKVEGRAVAAASREATIDAETVRVVAERVSERGLTRVVESRSGPVLAAAGVDASNVPPGTVLLLPADPDASARTLRAAIMAAAAVRIGVVISDTAGRPWRDGQTDLAIGAAGIRVSDDLRGTVDGFGTPLEVTVRALADELAAAADLVKGKLRGVPVAVVRGLAGLVTDDDGPGARCLLRTRAADWFALGHVEAVRSALGVAPGTAGIPAAPLLPDGPAARLRRALDVALARPPAAGRLPDLTVEVSAAGASILPAAGGPTGGEPGSPPDLLIGLGGLAERVRVAAWAEGLSVTCRVSGHRLIVVSESPVDPDSG